jgi:hypothetical protein
VGRDSNDAMAQPRRPPYAMNIKFSPQALRCRVTRAELDRLLTGRAVTLEVELPRHHHFRASVQPSATGGWQLDTDPTGLWLTIPRGELEALAETLPRKEGLEHAFPVAGGREIEVSFEVDVRDRKPRTDPAT